MDEDQLNSLTESIIGAAMEGHRALGPGLLEATYQKSLAHELKLRGHEVLTEVLLPISYKDLTIQDAYRIDIVVDHTIILELKAVEQLQNIHSAQLLTYLRLANKPLRLLLNFHVPRLKEGIRRLINKSI